jgi:hypothetical protein
MNKGNNGGFFSNYELYFKNNIEMIKIERDSIVIGKDDLIRIIVNKIKSTAFRNTYSDGKSIMAHLLFDVLIDAFKAEDVESGRVCGIAIEINWNKDEEFLTPLGFTRNDDGTILLDGYDYKDSLGEEILNKVRDIFAYYLESYKELK